MTGSGRALLLTLVVLVVLVAATAVALRHALLASRLGSRRPIRADTPTLARLSSVTEPVTEARRARQAGVNLPVALEAMARSLRAGTGLHAAVADGAAAVSGPLRVELHDVAEAVARGTPLVEALDQWRRASRVPGVRLAVHALSVAADIGGPQAASVDGVASTLRQRLAVQAEARALSAQARLSATVIAIAPVAFALLASAADADNAAFLLTTPVGLTMLVVGLALDGVGALWMARITRVGGPP